MVCFSFFTDGREWLSAARESRKALETRDLGRDPGKRLLLVGSENDDIEFVRMVETLGERESVGATVVVEEHCTTTRYFWDEVEESPADPLLAEGD